MMRGWRPIAVVGAATVLAGLIVPANAYQRPGTRTQVDWAANGQQPASGVAGSTSISHDGRYIAFDSDAADLVAGDNNNASDIFLRDTGTGRTRLVSHTPSGVPGAGLSSCVTGGTSCYGSPVRLLPSGLPNPDYGAWDPSISGDGRYVAFTSTDSNLVSGDTNVAMDVFVYDAKTGAVRRASVDSKGNQANGASYLPAMSADGRYVSFTSEATNLVAGDTNAYPDVFVHDLRTGATTLVSVSSSGAQGCQRPACAPSTITAPPTPMQSTVSRGGRYVAFSSDACGLVAVNNNCGQLPDTYVRDLVKRTTQLLSASVDGHPTLYPEVANRGNSGSTLAGPSSTEFYAASRAISDSGQFVVFVSGASNLVPDDPSWNPAELGSGLGVFVRDIVHERTYRVDVTSDGEPPMSHYANATTSSIPMSPSISADGRIVSMYCANCTALEPSANLQVYDRATGEAVQVPGFPNGASSANRSATQRWNGDENAEISGDGDYLSYVKYWTRTSAPGLAVLGPANGADVFRYRYGIPLGAGELSGRGVLSMATAAGADLTGATLIDRPSCHDLLVRLDLATMPSFAPAVLYGVDLTIHGTTYELRAAKTGTDAEFGLFRQDAGGSWTRTATLRGGYGTTGDEVVFAVPSTAIGASGGGRLTGVRAFTAVGGMSTGAARILDQISLT
jgi:hypothetical protein